MDISVLQLNFCQGQYLENFVPLIGQYAPDIITLQEVTGGEYSRSGFDNYDYLYRELGGIYDMSLIPRFHNVGDPSSYFANVTLTRKELGRANHRVVRLNYHETTDTPTVPKEGYLDPIRYPYSVLVTRVNALTIFNGHFTITQDKDPGYSPLKIFRNQILLDEIKSTEGPWILAGDFNTLAHDESVTMLVPEGGHNLILEHGINNTINPISHPEWSAIRMRNEERGVNCDNIITSRGIETISVRVLNGNVVSDHLPLLMDGRLSF